jgi:hypothetical protein
LLFVWFSPPLTPSFEVEMLWQNGVLCCQESDGHFESLINSFIFFAFGFKSLHQKQI